MRVVVDYDVDRLQVYNGDIKPSSTNCPKSFSEAYFSKFGVAAMQQRRAGKTRNKTKDRERVARYEQLLVKTFTFNMSTF